MPGNWKMGVILSGAGFQAERRIWRESFVTLLRHDRRFNGGGNLFYAATH